MIPPVQLQTAEAPIRMDSARCTRIWTGTTFIILTILVGLDWILGWVIWLPLYSGLFGFLVAGLLAGGAAFRVIRALRPLSRRHIFAYAFLLALANGAPALYWEYLHVKAGLGDLSGMRKLLIRAARDEKPRAGVLQRIESEYSRKLAQDYPPGGLIGYARWCMAGVDLPIQVDDAADQVTVGHRGWAWIIRTLVSIALTGIGIGFSFDGLRSAAPIRNTLQPGEEYEEIDD